MRAVHPAGAFGGVGLFGGGRKPVTTAHAVANGFKTPFIAAPLAVRILALEPLGATAVARHLNN